MAERHLRRWIRWCSRTPLPSHQPLHLPRPYVAVGVACPGALFRRRGKPRVTHAQLRPLWPFGPPPRPLPRPELPGGAGPRVQQPWLGLQWLPCSERRPGSVWTRSPAALTGTPSPSRSRNPSRSSPLSAQVLSPHAPRSLTCPTPAAPPLPTPSPRRLGTCWQVKSGKGAGNAAGAGARGRRAGGDRSVRSLSLPSPLSPRLLPSGSGTGSGEVGSENGSGRVCWNLVRGWWGPSCRLH